MAAQSCEKTGYGTSAYRQGHQGKEDRIYVKAWRHDYWDWAWEEEAKGKRQDILYCMDLNGKIKWKHTMEKQEVKVRINGIRILFFLSLMLQT